MNEINEKEKGLGALVSAMNTTIPRDVMHLIGGKIKELRAIEIPNYPITNRVLIALYDVLFDETQLGPEQGKNLFNRIQKRWVDNYMKGHEKEIFAESMLETLTNYNRIVNGSDIIVEPYGQGIDGVRIKMKDGCAYKGFCDNTGHRKCPKSTAEKYIVNYFGPEPYQFVLTRQAGTDSCVIDVISSLHAGDIMHKYVAENQPLTLL